MASTKLVVIKARELVYTAIFVALVIIMIIVLRIMFKKEDTKEDANDSVSASADVMSTNTEYIPGTYSSTVTLGGQTFNVDVKVDESSITDVSFENMDESVTVLYPLLDDSLEEINTQLHYVESIDDITSSGDTEYTTDILVKAIKNSLKNAAK